MFRSSTILRELVQSLTKVILMLKHSVKLRRCILCGDVVTCREMACVLFVVQTDIIACFVILAGLPGLRSETVPRDMGFAKQDLVTTHPRIYIFKFIEYMRF